MERGRKRWLLRMGVVLVAGAAMLLYALRQQAASVLTIVNHSGQMIVEMKVTAADQTVTYRDIDKEVIVPFVTRGDEPIMLRWKSQDGGLHAFKGRAERLKLIIAPDGSIQEASGGRR